MRRALTLVCISAAAVLSTAAAAAAQQSSARTTGTGQSLGLRYLSWSGKTGTTDENTTRSPVVPTRESATGLRRPAPIIPHGGGLTVARPILSDRDLTPVHAWAAPSPPTAVPVAASPIPTRTMDQASVAVVTTPSAPEAVADPMAPRSNALIFRMQPSVPPTPAAPAPSALAQSAGPSQQGARYYSVHRQNGRQPDPTPLPAPVYIDALAINLPDSPASQDLAAPPEPPTLMRNTAGRLQALPDNSTPDRP